MLFIYLFIYYARWQHKLKHTDKTLTEYTRKHKHKNYINLQIKSTNELQMAENKNLGKYSS